MWQLPISNKRARSGCLFIKYLSLSILIVFLVFNKNFVAICKYVLDAATSSGILKAKQKLNVTFNSDKLGGIDFTKFLKIPDDLTASNIQ